MFHDWLLVILSQIRACTLQKWYFWGVFHFHERNNDHFQHKQESVNNIIVIIIIIIIIIIREEYKYGHTTVWCLSLYRAAASIKIKCCEYEPEAITLIRNSFWLSSPKQTQVAFDLGFMALFQYIFLECRVSLLKSICQALQWLVPPASKVYVSIHSIIFLSYTH